MSQELSKLTYMRNPSATNDPNSPTLTIPTTSLPPDPASLELLKSYLGNDKSKYDCIKCTPSCWVITFAGSKNGSRRCEYVFRKANNRCIGGYRIKMQIHASGIGLNSRLQQERDRMSSDGTSSVKSSDQLREKKRRKLDSDGESLSSVPPSPSATSVFSMPGSVSGKPATSSPKATMPPSTSTPCSSTPQTSKPVRPRVSSSLRQEVIPEAEPQPSTRTATPPQTLTPQAVKTAFPSDSSGQRIAEWIASNGTANSKASQDEPSTRRGSISQPPQSTFSGPTRAKDLSKPAGSFPELMVEVMNKPDTPELLTSAQIVDLIRDNYPYYAEVFNQVTLKSNVAAYLSQNPRFEKRGVVEKPGVKAYYWSLHAKYSTRPRQSNSKQVVQAESPSMTPTKALMSSKRRSSSGTDDGDKMTRVDEMYCVRHDRSERFEIMSKNDQVKAWSELTSVKEVENMDDTYKIGDIVKVLVESGDEDFSFARILQLKQINDICSAALVMWFMSRSRAFRQSSNKQKKKWSEGEPRYQLTTHLGVISIQTVTGKASDAEMLQISVGPSIVDIGGPDYIIRSIAPECEKEVTWVKQLLQEMNGPAQVTQGKSAAPQIDTAQVSPAPVPEHSKASKRIDATYGIAAPEPTTPSKATGKRKRKDSEIEQDEGMSTYRSRDTPWKSRDEVTRWLKGNAENRDIKNPRDKEQVEMSLSAQYFLLAQEHEDMLDRKAQGERIDAMQNQLQDMQKQVAACLGEIKMLRTENENLRSSHKAHKETQNQSNKAFQSEMNKLRDRHAKLEAAQPSSSSELQARHVPAPAAPIAQDGQLNDLRKQLEVLQAASARHEQVMSNSLSQPREPPAAPLVTDTDLDSLRHQLEELIEAAKLRQQCSHDKDVDCPWAEVATGLQTKVEDHQRQIAQLKDGRYMKSALFPVVGEPDNVEIWRSPFRLPPNALIYHLKNDQRMWCRADERNTDGTPKYPTPGIPMIKVARDQITKAPPLTFDPESDDDDDEEEEGDETVHEKQKRAQEGEDVAMLD